MSEETYQKPATVTSPKEALDLGPILVDSGEGGYALALGKWYSQPVLLIRWNGTVEQQKGNPISTFHATWLVLPDEFQTAIVGTLSFKNQRIAREFLEA